MNFHSYSAKAKISPLICLSGHLSQRPCSSFPMWLCANHFSSLEPKLSNSERHRKKTNRSFTFLSIQVTVLLWLTKETLGDSFKVIEPYFFTFLPTHSLILTNDKSIREVILDSYLSHPTFRLLAISVGANFKKYSEFSCYILTKLPLSPSRKKKKKNKRGKQQIKYFILLFCMKSLKPLLLIISFGKILRNSLYWGQISIWTNYFSKSVGRHSWAMATLLCPQSYNQCDFCVLISPF